MRASVLLNYYPNLHSSVKCISTFLDNATEPNQILGVNKRLEFGLICMLWKRQLSYNDINAIYKRLLVGGLVRPYDDTELVNIGSGNGLMPDSTKSLPDQMLTYH